MPPPDPIAGIVLAAGSSTRMGRNKLLLPIEGEPLLRRSVRQALEAGLDPVLVVLGHEAPAAARALRRLRCRPVINPEFARGIATSLHAGIRSVPPGARAAVVVLADMPFVTAAMIAAVVDRYRASGARLVLSAYGDVTAPPTLYDRALFDELLATGAEACGKQVAKRHRREAATVAWPSVALADVDVPDDYSRVTRSPLDVSEAFPRR